MEHGVSRMMSHSSVSQHGARSGRRQFYNPFDADEPSDPIVATTDRRINRLVAVAAEAGAQYATAISESDPLLWMYSPSNLFEGEAPFSACIKLEHFRSAIAHQSLAADDSLHADYSTEAVLERSESDGERRRAHRRSSARSRRLYTATVVSTVGTQCTHSFHAIVADDFDEVADRLRQRCGTAIARKAIIRPGFDPSDPLAVALVSDAVADMLLLIDAEPASSLADGLEVQIETRFDHAP